MNLWEKGLQLFRNTSPPPVQYHGLLNQGATCYLNSVLQVLFMSKDFRTAVKRHTSENPDTEFIDRQLATLFDDLEGQKAYTYNITKKLGIDRVYEQRDAAEYFEKILSLTSPEASQIFHGALTHETKCSRCGRETGSDGAFWHLPLAMADSYNKSYRVVDGIEEHFRASYFSGENQMYCDECDDKSDATMKCAVKHHPEVLMLLLKRFEFDYSYMTYVKNNRPVDVPSTLQIPENQKYELYAVVDHCGDLRSGHYAAMINIDKRWYHFNDDRVTLLEYQPFQVDNFEESRSAYLLFYRRMGVRAADTCAQDTKEVSTPGGFPPAPTDVYEECQEPVTMRERKEVEEAAEQGDDTAVVGDFDRDEDKGIKDSVEGRDEGKIITNAEKYMGRNEKADDQAKERENLLRETQFGESFEDQDIGSRRLDDVRQRGPQEGLEGDDINNTSRYDQKYEQEVITVHVRQEYPQEVCVDMPKEEIMVNRGKDGKMEGDEQSERRGKASGKYLPRDAEHQDGEGLDDGQQDLKDNLWGMHKVGRDYGLKHVSVEQSVDEERMETSETYHHFGQDVEDQNSGGLDDFRHEVGRDYGLVSVEESVDEGRMQIDEEVDKEDKTGVGERVMASEKGKGWTRYDLCYGRVGDSNRPKDDLRSKQVGSSRFQRHEQQREEKRDVKEDKKQKRREDKHAQRRETSETYRHFGQDVEDQNSGGLDDFRGNRSEQKSSVTHTRYKDDSVDRQTKEQENRGDRHQNKVASCLGRAESAGSRRATEQCGSVEKTRQRDSQAKARAEFNADAMESRPGSKKSTYYKKVIDEEIKGTPRAVQRSSETEYVLIKTIEETSQECKNRWVEKKEGRKGKSERKRDAKKVTLSKDLCNLKLSESQKHRTKRLTGHAQEERSSTTYSDASQTHAVSFAGIKHAKKKSKRPRSWWHRLKPLKQNGEEKIKKKKKTTGCNPFSFKRRKNAERTTDESD